MFHAAITIFHPHKEKQFEYLHQLARVRLENFALQEKVTELSIVTCITPKTSTFLDLLLKSRGFEKVDIYILHGRAHAAEGYTQMLIEPETEWVYFCDDGHVIPTQKGSVQGWFNQTVELVGEDSFDILVEASRLRQGSISKKEHRNAYHNWLDQGSPEPTLWCQEWGYYQRASTLRKYLRPPQLQQTQNGTFFLHQGARVAYSNIRPAWFVHHHLSAGPCSFSLFDESQRMGGVCSVEVDSKWNFKARFFEVAREKLFKLTPIRRVSYRRGELIRDEENYLPNFM